MTLDRFCDHRVIILDNEIHQHYADLLSHADTALYGRIPFQLVECWQTVVENPIGNEAMDEFALIMDNIPKTVVSHTLSNVGWENAK